MANLRCTTCGRYVNDPWDHDPDCALYAAKDRYVHDEDIEAPVEPDVVHNEPTDVETPTPDVETPVVPDVETKEHPPGWGSDQPGHVHGFGLCTDPSIGGCAPFLPGPVDATTSTP